jgi:hypothetical protein
MDRGILIDIVDMTSAIEMWEFLEETMRIDSLENQAGTEDRLRALKLKDNANSEMDNHYRSLDTLHLEAKGVGVTLNVYSLSNHFPTTSSLYDACILRRASFLIERALRVQAWSMRVTSQVVRSWSSLTRVLSVCRPKAQ